ncbi:hypothetical protein ATK74_1837 [Propionicimonas paludicola]|uniref:Bacterial SCP orthologue domain-containing protein n=2 Tax=Propionicimonas paludicola TaxID=185243 RepID=A0A2A9CSX3_9ACTN|nr:hypothetical protein ATK74_1837 [Propionicimonas paludicola]
MCAELATGTTDLSPSDLARAARTTCALLGARYPGGSVEVRVPPVAAVQLGIGERGRHTRGTPPNVVQTDAITLLRLAGGTLGWADALADHLVTASGVHSDLDGLWPLPELVSAH